MSATMMLPAMPTATPRVDEGFWVAVLPFRCAGSNADLSVLAEGLSEEIVTGLSRFSYLRVISHGAASGRGEEAAGARAAADRLYEELRAAVKVCVERYRQPALIESQADMTVSAQFASGEEALAAYRPGFGSIILMDLRLPGIGGVEAIVGLPRLDTPLVHRRVRQRELDRHLQRTATAQQLEARLDPPHQHGARAEQRGDAACRRAEGGDLAGDEKTPRTTPHRESRRL